MVTALSLLAILIAGMFLGTMSAAIMQMREEDEARDHIAARHIKFRNFYRA